VVYGRILSMPRLLGYVILTRRKGSTNHKDYRELRDKFALEGAAKLCLELYLKSHPEMEGYVTPKVRAEK
jgi:hypothetical protein